MTYVGKDIAYHLWKFGLLGRDFGYSKFFTYPDARVLDFDRAWREPSIRTSAARRRSTTSSIRGRTIRRHNWSRLCAAWAITEQADHCIHFGYEMVALTPRCALELGYRGCTEEDRNSPYIEVSGRKGFGVKADDLIDKLIEATRAEVDARQTDRDEEERQKIAKQIAIGALRYFMLKFTRNSVIAFDFKDALSFEGETGPYIQYAVVRARNIFRKGAITPEAVLREFKGADRRRISHGRRGRGHLGVVAAGPDAVRLCSISALPHRSRPISPSTPFSLRRSSTTSTTSTTCSPKRITNDGCSCWLPLP